VVLHTKVSPGIPNNQSGSNGIPTITPEGRYNIMSKLPSKHMGNARLTDNLDDYVLLGVPWTSFFTETGVAFHGTYWHSNFGWPMSRGCVNMRNEDAKWLFRWLLPVSEPWDWDKRGYGTQIIVK
jgi:lipoprotein-anchoring transpeptidase ErfK/SrfK